MLIAYDPRFAADHFTGIGTHAYCLLEALLELPGDERYAVLWDDRQAHRRYDPRPFATHPRVAWHERPIAPLAPGSLLAVGAWLRDVRADFYLSPFYFLPARAPCPCALTIHDVWPLRLDEGFSLPRRLLYRWSLRRARGAAAILTSSEFSRREIVELAGIPGERVHAVPLGVPTRRAALAPRRPDAAPEDRFALAVGDNRPRKNLCVLAAAWARSGDAPSLALVAAGPEYARYPSLQRLAEREGASRVVSLGWCDEPELAWLYEHAELLLFPSLYEGFGFPLVEAFDRGLPVIAADIPVLREIGEGPVRFVEPRDAGAWARAVRELESDAPARARAIAAGRARAAELSYCRTAERTLDVLRQVAGRAPHGALAGVRA